MFCGIILDVSSKILNCFIFLIFCGRFGFALKTYMLSISSGIFRNKSVCHISKVLQVVACLSIAIYIILFMFFILYSPIFKGMHLKIFIVVPFFLNGPFKILLVNTLDSSLFFYFSMARVKLYHLRSIYSN